jgi:hypothetical protein
LSPFDSYSGVAIDDLTHTEANSHADSQYQIEQAMMSADAAAYPTLE